MYALVWTAGFTRAAKKFVDQHRDLRAKLAATLRDLEIDPFQSHLKYHHLTGKLKGIQAVSITRSYRITLTVMITDKEIILLDIGSHCHLHKYLSPEHRPHQKAPPHTNPYSSYPPGDHRRMRADRGNRLELLSPPNTMAHCGYLRLLVAVQAQILANWLEAALI